VSDLGTIFGVPFLLRFHGLRESDQRPQRAAILRSHVVLVITTLPTAGKIRQSEKLCRPYLEASEPMPPLAGHRRTKGTGILTGFPGSCFPVEDALRIG
jgi:hypothetical protein